MGCLEDKPLLTTSETSSGIVKELVGGAWSPLVLGGSLEN